MSQPTNWKSYPFSVDGVDFVSLIRPNSEFDKRISLMSIETFAFYNQSAIRELIGKVSLFSKSEIQDKLDTINENYHSAYLALA